MIDAADSVIDSADDGDHVIVSGAKKLSLYEEVLRQVRYVNSEPQELNSRSFVLSCTELNGRFVSNRLETTVRRRSVCLSVREACSVLCVKRLLQLRFDCDSTSIRLQ